MHAMEESALINHYLEIIKHNNKINKVATELEEKVKKFAHHLKGNTVKKLESLYEKTNEFEYYIPSIGIVFIGEFNNETYPQD